MGQTSMFYKGSKSRSSQGRSKSSRHFYHCIVNDMEWRLAGDEVWSPMQAMTTTSKHLGIESGWNSCSC